MKPAGRPRSRTANRRWWSMSAAMKARSICCWRWRGSRRSISPRSRFWRWPTNISPFIEAARKIRLELAADYLVMAAWLAFLKSRLLLPEPPTPDGPSAEEMATALANRLRRLEAIREAANRLMNRPQFQRDIFPRGNPETIAEIRHPKFTATLFDLLTAYAAQRQQRVLATRASGQAHGVVAGGGARLAGAAGRHGRGLELPRRISCSTTSSIPRRRRPCLPRALPRRWNWCAKARWN